jgi:hypothetical protein
VNGPLSLLGPGQVPEAVADPAAPPQWGRGSPSSGSGPRLIKVPPARVLVRFDGATLATAQVTFRVPVPDSRLRVGIKVLGYPQGAVARNFLAGKNVKLWLYAADELDNGTTIPVTDLSIGSSVSTQSAPVTIPVDPGLGGFAREMVTSADYIEGVLTCIGVANGVKGQLILAARYQPEAGANFSWDEWAEIRALCDPSPTSPIATVG